VQVVRNGRIERVPVRIGIRGSRNVEIIGEVSRGMAVLSPARVDLADGTKVWTAMNNVKLAADTPEDMPQADPITRDAPAAPQPPVATTDPDSAVIATAMTAHIDSVVNDARRNVTKFGGNR
jgi:hypothetical protein